MTAVTLAQCSTALRCDTSVLGAQQLGCIMEVVMFKMHAAIVSRMLQQPQGIWQLLHRAKLLKSAACFSLVLAVLLCRISKVHHILSMEVRADKHLCMAFEIKYAADQASIRGCEL